MVSAGGDAVAGAAAGDVADDVVRDLLRRATGNGNGNGSGHGSARGRTNGFRRVPTSTYRFGASRRESHDASEFYERFPAPEVSEDDHVNPPAAVDQVWAGDARSMDQYGQIADGSVALVVTSPPYYAGKEYETAIGEGHVPASYIAYVEMLHDVFAECRRKLEPGGRIAVNVANLGRKPYRSLSADVIDVLQDLGFLIRGEIIWVKGKAAGGSCAWGTFQRPGNPVLRDVSERIIVASKGRFDRARGARDRAADGLPSVATISADEFMELTTDVWEFPPESATRVGHPAPFPVELPRRLIDLYTYEGDLVLDPFIGSGTTAVAAIRTGRHYVGFDTDPAYVTKALTRIQEERAREATSPTEALSSGRSVRIPAAPAKRTTPQGDLERRPDTGLPAERRLAVRNDPGTGRAPGTANSTTNPSDAEFGPDDRPHATPRMRSDAGVPPADQTTSADEPGVGGAADSAGDATARDGFEFRSGAGTSQVGSPIDASPGLEPAVDEAGDQGLDAGAAPLHDVRFAGVERAVREGRKVADVAKLLLQGAGFRDIRDRGVKAAPGVEVSFRARDERGETWFFDLAGGFSNGNPGLRKADTLWKALGKASVIAASGAVERLVFLTVERPLKGSAPAKALAAVCGTGPGKTIADVICLTDPDDQQRLRRHATGAVEAAESSDDRGAGASDGQRGRGQRAGGSGGRRPPRP